MSAGAAAAAHRHADHRGPAIPAPPTAIIAAMIAGGLRRRLGWRRTRQRLMVGMRMHLSSPYLALVLSRMSATLLLTLGIDQRITRAASARCVLCQDALCNKIVDITQSGILRALGD